VGSEHAHRHQVGVAQVVQEAPHVAVETRVDAVDVPHLRAYIHTHTHTHAHAQTDRQTDMQTHTHTHAHKRKTDEGTMGRGGEKEKVDERARQIARESVSQAAG